MMPQSKSNRFDLANFMKARKDTRQKAVEQSKAMKTGLKTKVDDARGVLTSLTNQNENIQPRTCVSPPGDRTRPPTCLVDGTSNLPLRTATKRRHETLVAAARIHGGSENNPKPALDGMFDTLNKRCKLNTMKDYVLSNDKLKDRVVSNVYRGNVRSFENSPTNVKRS